MSLIIFARSPLWPSASQLG